MFLSALSGFAILPNCPKSVALGCFVLQSGVIHSPVSVCTLTASTKCWGKPAYCLMRLNVHRVSRVCVLPHSLLAFGVSVHSDLYRFCIYQPEECLSPGTLLSAEVQSIVVDRHPNRTIQVTVVSSSVVVLENRC